VLPEGVPLSERPPKKPLGAYFIFLSRTRSPTIKTMDEYLTASKDAAMTWRNMTDAEKQVSYLVTGWTNTPH